jgi:hypothetical protein
MVAMYLTAADLIDMTVKQLELLADILREDAKGFSARRDEAHRDVRRCEDARAGIQALIPKLIAARATQQSSAQMQLPGSSNEDQI